MTFMMSLYKDYKSVLYIVFMSLCFSINSCAVNIKDTDLFDVFVNRMVTTYQFDKTQLNDLFKSVEIKEDIIKKYLPLRKQCLGISTEKYL